MKFCPKCSLKIKGNVTQCPICKVELLSCAEDDEQIPRPPKEEDQQHEISDTDQTPSTEGAIPDREAKVNSKVTTTADKSDHTSDYPNLNERIEKLEDGFGEMDSKLNTSLSQHDVFNDAATDLESRITKAEQTLDTLKHALETPSEHIQQVEKEISRLTLHINHIIKDLESVKSNVANLETNLVKPSSSFEETATHRDLPIEKKESQETSFPEQVEEDFGNEFEIHTPPQGEEVFAQPQPERRKFSLTIILILFAVVIFSWLGFYYLKSQTQESNKELITEKIEISPILKNDIVDASKRSADMEQPSKVGTDETKPKETGESVSPKNYARTTSKTTKGKSTPLKESKARQTTFKKVSGYTVNVGSFKDKNRALALTKKLMGKGYSAVMSASENNHMYRVRVGAFSSFKEALSYSASLEKKEKLPTFIATINMP